MSHKNKEETGAPHTFRVIQRGDKRERHETEVAAQLTIPHDGGWGWVVVFSSFFTIFILDGVTFTFGALLTDIALDMNVAESLAALINSTAVALYFIGSPFASALINRYGFRECAMCGSVICTMAMLISYFANVYVTLFLFYGIFAGFGYALINMSSSLIVGFYFEKFRSVAMAISTCGSSIGVMALFPLNSYLVHLGGWRATVLLHSGLFALLFFFALTYRPLISFHVTMTREDQPTSKTSAFLPRVTSTRSATPTTKQDSFIIPTATEKLFQAASNYHFPTVADLVKDDQGTANAVGLSTQTVNEAGPSTAVASKITLTPLNAAVSAQKIRRVQSNVSRISDKIEIKVDNRSESCQKPSMFRWNSHVPQSRPLYRDDAFYQGKLGDLPEYKKAMQEKGEEKTGLEYQMAVSRAAAVHDIEERRGLMTTAVRRVLATMMDPGLLKRTSYLLLCASGFLTYVGFLVPYVYLQERNGKEGISVEHCSFFVSAIGASNAVGRLVLGMLASKIDPLKLFAVSCILAGICTMVSDLSFHLYYQYAYCILFGFFIAGVAVLRSLILVSLYGLDRLTNATGMMLIFLGLGNLLSTPIAAIIKDNFGYRYAFILAGAFITASGLILLPVKSFFNSEQQREKSRQQVK